MNSLDYNLKMEKFNKTVICCETLLNMHDMKQNKVSDKAILTYAKINDIGIAEYFAHEISTEGIISKVWEFLVNLFKTIMEFLSVIKTVVVAQRKKQKIKELSEIITKKANQLIKVPYINHTVQTTADKEKEESWQKLVNFQFVKDRANGCVKFLTEFESRTQILALSASPIDYLIANPDKTEESKFEFEIQMKHIGFSYENKTLKLDAFHECPTAEGYVPNGRLEHINDFPKLMTASNALAEEIVKWDVNLKAQAFIIERGKTMSDLKKRIASGQKESADVCIKILKAFKHVIVIINSLQQDLVKMSDNIYSFLVLTDSLLNKIKKAVAIETKTYSKTKYKGEYAVATA